MALEYTTIKLPKSVKRRLEEYARSKGLTLAGAVARLLEEESVRELLIEILDVLKEQNGILKEILEVVSGDKIGREASTEPEDIPSFAEDNPWIAVLRGRRR